MENSKPEQGNLYRIRVKEILDRTTTDWFGEVSLTPLEGGGTLLTGSFPDQSALRGFLDRLWNLNFTVVSVERAGNGISCDPAGEERSI